MIMPMSLINNKLFKKGLLPLFYILLCFQFIGCKDQPQEKIFKEFIEFNFNKYKSLQKFNLKKTILRGEFIYQSKIILILQDLNSSTVIYLDKKTNEVIKEFKLPMPESCDRVGHLLTLAPDSFLYTDPINRRLILCTDSFVLKISDSTELSSVPYYQNFTLGGFAGLVKINNDILLAMDVNYGIAGINTDSIFEHTPSQYKCTITSNGFEISPTSIYTITSRYKGEGVSVYDYTPSLIPFGKDSFLLYQTTSDSINIIDLSAEEMKVAEAKVRNSKYEIRPVFYPSSISYEEKFENVYDKVALNHFASSVVSGKIYRLIHLKKEDFKDNDYEIKYRILETLDQNFQVEKTIKISPKYIGIVFIDNMAYLKYVNAEKNILRYELME